MNRILKIAFSFTLGAWAALFAWALLNYIFQYRSIQAFESIPAQYIQAALSGALVGLFAGPLLAGLEKFINTRRLLLTFLGGTIGVFTGVIGGAAGLLFAQFLFDIVPPELISPGSVFKDGLRLIGWGIFGFGVGLGPGLATWSIVKTFLSSLGGCLGGLIGGGVLMAVVALSPAFVQTGSAIGFTLMGFFVGLFIAVIQQIGVKATLKITEQRIPTKPSEGRTFEIDKRKVTIGNGSGDDWVIANDPNLVPHYAEIRQEGKRLVIHSRVPQRPVLIGGKPAPQHVLQDGDRFTIGATTIAFKAK